MTRPSAKEWGAALALYTLLTGAMTWPFALRLNIIDAGDSAYFAWAVGFQLHALKTDPLGLPHGNFYAPSRFTLFMDEPVLGTGLLVLPVSWFTDDAILLFNLARLLTWVLTGLFTWRLGRDIGMEPPAALATGAFFAFSPIRVDQLAHLSTLGTQWIPLTYLFARRFCIELKVADAARTGLFFALSFLACGYHGLFFAVLLPVSLLPLLFGSRVWNVLSRGVSAVLVAAALLYPLYALSREALGPLRFVRSTTDTLKYAASVETFLAANRGNKVWGALTENFRGDPSNLFPGLVVVVLALTALVHLGRRIRSADQRLMAALALLGLTAALLALGPEIRLGGVAVFPGPFALLRDYVPVFSSIRATGRAGIFVALALALLSGLALKSLRRSALVSGIAVVLFLVEARIAPIPAPAFTNVIDSRRVVPPVYQWLRNQPAEAIVAELPARPASDFGRPAFHDSIYMVWSTMHWQRLVNGFAAAETPLIQRFRATAGSFPEAESLAVMREAGTKYIVVHLRGFGPNQRERMEALVGQVKDRLREVARFVNSERPDFDVDVVYELIGP